MAGIGPKAQGITKLKRFYRVESYSRSEFRVRYAFFFYYCYGILKPEMKPPLK